MEQQNKCVICNGSYKGHGHNAQPVKDGRCCTDCNWMTVIPARVSAFQEQKLKAISNLKNTTKGDQK